MRKFLLVLLFFIFLLHPSLSQEISVEEAEKFLNPLISFLNSTDFVPHFQSEEGGYLENPNFRGFVVIFLMFWMIFDIVMEINSIPSFFFSFFLTSWLFNNFPDFFNPSTATSMFKVVFSALFLFVMVDFLLRYFWAISKTTRLLFNISITLMGVLMMDFLGIAEQATAWISGISTFGFLGFIVLMFGIRIFNTYIGLMRLSSAKAIRRLGALETERRWGDFKKALEGLRNMPGGFR